MLRRHNSGTRAWLASGEPWIWLNAAAVGISILAVAGLLTLIAVRGLAHFWPSDVRAVEYRDEFGQAQIALGELADTESLSPRRYAEIFGAAEPQSATVERWLLKTGNRRYNPPDFRWLFARDVTALSYPQDVVVFERMEWGNAYGYLVSVSEAGAKVPTTDVWQTLNERLDRARGIRADIDALEQTTLNEINYQLEQLRLESRTLDSGNPRAAELDARSRALQARYDTAEAELRALYELLKRDAIDIRLASGQIVNTSLADIVRAWRPNQMSTLAKLGHYFTSMGLFVSEQPREANTEGGIFPAIFGTVMMVLLMSLLVTPLGVVAAVYLREYARQGAFVRLIRIAVNNLAGVPSIVYGVFGLGFFVYFIGGNIDQLFYPEALPAPTFGTPGLLWASLTLALLTVPVVVVSTEEGLTRIPRAIREGSLALGATKAETLFKVVLPMASPSILTGVILAVARAAGEVAPLMLVGVVKLAPTLPMDGNFPFVHLERKFMHLGFHIYDVGFQSPNVDAARPLVYATALLLVLIIIVLNLTAIMLRNRLENRYRGVES
jgi:phosphate transport system permease protein